MAINPNESAAFGMYKAVQDSEAIFGSTNKEYYPAPDDTNKEDEYESSMSDVEITQLTAQWVADYAPYYAKIKPTQEKAFNYWLGKQQSENLTVMDASSDPKPLVDNVIFTAVETFLPLATRANPDPVVAADPGDIGQKIAHALHAALVYEADRQKLRRKLARVLRRWSWDRLGALKIYWDYRTKEIVTKVVTAKDLIFDKDGYIDEGGIFRGEYIGHRKKDTAADLAEMFPKKKAAITLKVEGKMATKITYIEWWYKGRELFYTMDGVVLGKFKNPNWNYDLQIRNTPNVPDETGSAEEESVEAEAEIKKAVNFHKEPMAPFVFLSVFSSGTQPYDETSLILQNVGLQDIVNRRVRQIDKNVTTMNEGLVVSGDAFDADQASNAANALRKGQAILVPNGDVNKAVAHINPGNLPSDVFRQLDDMRAEIMNIAGTAGSTPQGLQDQKSVRGKIMISQQDTSRIGGTITEQLEQVADTVYNFWVQFMFVFYDDEHFVTTAGAQGGRELVTVKNNLFPVLKTLDVTVKEGSLIPKDPLTQRNEAIDLWSANAIDPLNFYKRLDVPDPAQMTQSLILWQMLQKGVIPPQAYLPSFQVQQPTIGGLPGEQPGTGGPAVNPSVPAQNLNPSEVMPGTPPAVNAQESALIKSIPIQ